MNNKQFELAARDENQAIALTPNDAAAYANRALIYWHLGEIERARADAARGTN
jgi:regulator of sirC expression with transglutaminase-like and TPR domain